MRLLPLLFIFTLLASCGKLAEENNIITDNDGNEYHTVTIGTQTWMLENLRAKKYRNGDSIAQVQDQAAWDTLQEAACSAYMGSSDTATTYGLLYNYKVIEDSRNIAPYGWHVATQSDWLILQSYLGGYMFAGRKLKEAGTAHWADPNDATNAGRFKAYGAGARESNFKDLKLKSTFWTATSNAVDQAVVFKLSNDQATLTTGNADKVHGYSIRCVKD